MFILTVSPEAAGVLNELCSSYPQESRQHEVKVAAIVCLVLTLFIVGLRSIARFTVTSRLWWDDWTILTATVRNPPFPLAAEKPLV